MKAVVDGMRRWNVVDNGRRWWKVAEGGRQKPEDRRRKKAVGAKESRPELMKKMDLGRRHWKKGGLERK